MIIWYIINVEFTKVKRITHYKICRRRDEKGYFLMIKMTSDIKEIPVFASMWNMDGLILIRFCKVDYENLRNPI